MDNSVSNPRVFVISFLDNVYFLHVLLGVAKHYVYQNNLLLKFIVFSLSKPVYNLFPP